MSTKTPYIKLSVNKNTRTEIRKKVIEEFLKEDPGTGQEDNVSRFHYLVEDFKGNKIELHRPARLNKGFDFTINFNFFAFRGGQNRSKCPSHSQVIETLKLIKQEDPTKYQNAILPLIIGIFNCSITKFSKESNLGTFKDCDGNERPIEILLLCIKWFFIEQDTTYWNYSGREMFKNSLIENGLI